MDKVYQRAEDKNVAAILIYVNEGKGYTDAEHTNQYTREALKNAFIKGALVVNASGYYTPTGYSETGGIGTVEYKNGTTSSVLVSATD